MHTQSKQILSWKELLVVGAIIVLTVIAYNVVFLSSFFYVPHGFSFVGLVGIPQWDLGVYFSMIEQVKQGQFFVHNLFTSESSGAGLLHPLWLVLGWIARLLQLSSLEVFFWSRIVAGVVFMFAGYAVAVRLVTVNWARVLAVVGLGWFAGFGRWLTLNVSPGFWSSQLVRDLAPVDLWWSEGMAYLTLEHSILFISSQLILLALWWLAVREVQYKSWLLAVGVGIMGLIHPYDIPIFWAVLMVWFGLLWLCKDADIRQYARALVPAAAGTLAVLVYYAWHLMTDLTLAGWAEQNVTLAPSAYAFIAGYGWMWVLALMSIIVLFKKIHTSYDRFSLLVIAWFFTLPFLIYVPIQISRRFINSFGVVIVILTAMALPIVWQWYKKHVIPKDKSGTISGLVIIFVALTTTLSPLFKVVDSVYQVTRPGTLVYLPTTLIDVAQELQQTDSDAIILTTRFWGNLIPGFSGRRVFFGHAHQTIQHDYKHSFVKIFYAADTTQIWRDQFIMETGVTHVVWEQDRADEIGDAWEVWYRNDDFVVYKVP